MSPWPWTDTLKDCAVANLPLSFHSKELPMLADAASIVPLSTEQAISTSSSALNFQSAEIPMTAIFAGQQHFSYKGPLGCIRHEIVIENQDILSMDSCWCGCFDICLDEDATLARVPFTLRSSKGFPPENVVIDQSSSTGDDVMTALLLAPLEESLEGAGSLCLVA